MTTTPDFLENKLAQLLAVMASSFLVGNTHHPLLCPCYLAEISYRRCICGSHRVRGVDVGVRRILLLDSQLTANLSCRVNYRSMPVIHKTLFTASIIMFLISVVNLGLIMEELNAGATSVTNRRAQLALAIFQVASECLHVARHTEEVGSISLENLLLSGGNACRLDSLRLAES